MILITGGGGYVGSVLTKQLVKKGYKVRVWDKFFFGESPLNPVKNKIDIVKADIRDIKGHFLDKVESIIHLAALSNDPTAEFNPKANFEINTEATLALAKTAKEKGVKKFIFASSCSIYDMGVGFDKEVKDEKSKVNPVAAYSLSKYKAEKGLLKIANSDFGVVILRKGTVFGHSPRLRLDLVVNTMLKDAILNKRIIIHNKGTHSRPLVEIEDVARAYIKTLEVPASKINKEIINISLDNFTVFEIASKISQELKRNFGIKTKLIYEKSNGKIRSYKVSNEKAKQLLNFSAKNGIEEAISKLMMRFNKSKKLNLNNPIYYNIEWMRPRLETGI